MNNINEEHEVSEIFWHSQYALQNTFSLLQQRMLVDLVYIFLCGSFGFENFDTCIWCEDDFIPKISWTNNYFWILGRVSKWTIVKLFSQLTPMLVDFEYLLLNTISGLETFPTCYQHKDNRMPKISCWNNKLSALGRVSKLEVVKWFFPLFLTTTHVGRFGMWFFWCIFWTWKFTHM